MSVRLTALVLGVAIMLGTAALTYAANKTLNPAAVPVPTVTAKPVALVVPDVRRQAYVFAKGMLEDSGFAWRVRGGVRGFAANVVATQSPQPGTRVLDNGAPTIVLTLSRNGKYGQQGSPEDVAPYAGTPVLAADLTVAAPVTKPVVKPVAVAKPVVKPVVKPAAKPVAKAPAKKLAPKPATLPKLRPVAFKVAGAPKEPLDELPLVDRAKALGVWLDAHPKPTNANVSHWLYQHEWVVQGAKFGWWHGSDALRVLIQDDQRAEKLWGIGTKSRLRAQSALAQVTARAA